MMKSSYSEFLKEVKKVTAKRKRIVSNCWDLRDYYRYFRKKYPKYRNEVSQVLYSDIIRKIHKEIINTILNGLEVKLPKRTGDLLVIKFPRFYVKGNEVHRAKDLINWPATLKYWYEDEEAKQNKVLIKYSNDTIYKVKFFRPKNSAFVNVDPFFNRSLQNAVINLAKDTGL